MLVIVFSEQQMVMAGGEEVKKEAQVAGARGIFSSLVGRDVLFWRPIPYTGGLWAPQATRWPGRISRSESKTACGAVWWRDAAIVKRPCKQTSERLADQALPETEVSDERSPSRDGRQEPLLYQGSPVKRGHQAQRCEMFYLAEDLRHLSLGWHRVRVEHELIKMEKGVKTEGGTRVASDCGDSTCSCRVRETMEPIPQCNQKL